MTRFIERTLLYSLITILFCLAAFQLFELAVLYPNWSAQLPYSLVDYRKLMRIVQPDFIGWCLGGSAWLVALLYLYAYRNPPHRHGWLWVLFVCLCAELGLHFFMVLPRATALFVAPLSTLSPELVAQYATDLLYINAGRLTLAVLAAAASLRVLSIPPVYVVRRKRGTTSGTALQQVWS